MLSTIYDVTKSAQSTANKNGRNAILKSPLYSTDIPNSTDTAYAWPKIYRNSTDKGETEIYLGSIKT